MKICVFSDIHGNLAAFEAARALIIKESADVNLYLGDLCGYYFDEISVWRRLIELPRLVALRGNHEEMFIRAVDGDLKVHEEYRSKYGPALDLFLGKDHAEVIAWLKKLPSSWNEPGTKCAAYHGSPWNFLEEYIYPDTPLERFKGLQNRWVFLGHTHYPMDRSEGSVRIINPGSLGQPRDGNWPSFTVVDLGRGEVGFREVYYDNRVFAREVRLKASKNPYLYEVIERIVQRG